VEAQPLHPIRIGNSCRSRSARTTALFIFLACVSKRGEASLSVI
jgi:hypothetical protein